MKNNSVETGLEIAVIGMAGKFPGAKNLEEFWENLKNGIEAISFFSTEELKECGINEALLNNPNYVKAYGVIEGREYFDASFFGYSPKEAETLDPLIRLLHECSWEALENAGYDPMSYPGSIGMYAGASDGFGWQVALRLKSMMDKSENVAGHMTDCTLLLSSRLSHKLNLRGPSITMFTACSTGLVTIHTACRALLTGECEMALAGSGSVLTTDKAGYLYQEGMIMSPDGHCRAFDEKAKGTVYGEGAGVVLLKRLKDARTDGDTIRCIIKASVVNNDGTGKASFTAPGKKRIADVIRTALKLSRLEPEDIGYIEAHGTATSLGDAIEIEALKEAFNTGKKGLCGIGSVKSNFGHLDVNAGIASFIKTVLSLMHRLIPPTLHFESPNPKMDFINSPFYVNNILSQWENHTETNGSLMRAGVCSFGVGGTNAFVLVEEAAPELPAATQNKMPQLLVLSARTESALDKMTGNLVDYLKENPDVNLGDVAYTLQVGRRVFNHRRMLVCSTVEEVVAALSSPGNGAVQTSEVKGKGRSSDLVPGIMDKLSEAFQPAGQTGEAVEMFKEIGMAWLKGTKIEWQEFYSEYLKNTNQERSRIPLPMYPFERERFWIDVGPLEIFKPYSGNQMERLNSREELEQGETIPVEEKVLAGLYPRPPLSTEYTAPGDEIEEALVEIWQKFFGIREVGIYDDFFELGGDSLKAITVVLEIHKRMDTRIPVTEIFQSPTIIELAKYIKGAETDEYSAIEPVEEREYLPLSSVQRRMYILQQINIKSTGYNDTLIFEIEGQLDKDHLEKVFNKLVSRHESLRTSFRLIDEEYVQEIHREIEFMVAFYDLSSETNHEVPIKEWQIIQQFVRPFDLSQAPLLRVGLIRRNDENHVLMTDMHHIITDGTSIGILIREFLVLYTGESLPCLRIQYKDYTQWQNSDKQRKVIKEQEAYWLKVFEDEIPVLNFPTDYVRPATMSFEGSKKELTMNREETKALKKAASAQDATLFMILLSVYNVMLAKICVQEDIVVGIPIAARTHADLQSIIGMLVNTLAVRNYPSKEKTFREFLEEVRENTLAAFENQDYLFEDLVEGLTENAKLNRDTSRNPVFDTLFNLLNIQSQYEANLEIKSPGLSLKPYEHQREASVFDLVFQGSEVQNGLFFTIEFRTHLFKPETIHRLFCYFRRIAAVVTASPDIRLAEIEIISGEERRILLMDFNDTKTEYPRDKTIHELFEEQAEKNPDRVAVVGQGEKVQDTGSVPMAHVFMSYKELNEESNQLAQLLRAKGVGPNVIVSIIMERSVGLIIGLLGILKAGGAYLPIDPQYPQGRIDFMLKDSGAKILLSELSELSEVSGGIEVIKPGECSEEYPTHLVHLTLPTHLCYLIYTSGTTGTPRGVLIRHRGVINMINCNRSVFGEGLGERVSQAASPGFDAMGFEVWPCLLSGAALYIADNEVRANPAGLKEWLIREGITISFQPTIIAEELLEEEWPEQGVCLRILRTAGDRLKKYPARSYPFRFYNLYGPTEDTVWTTWTEVEVKVKVGEGKTKYPTIGKPIDNHRVYILSTDLSLQPIGVSGELCIAGEGLSVGYLNNPELTAEKFILAHSSWLIADRREKNAGRSGDLPKSYELSAVNYLYKTGDLARWLPDGNIEFLGRLDHQVKVRGYRIELGEIENSLMALARIKEAVVITRSGDNDEKYLCAYVVIKNESEIDVSLLRQELSIRLPDFMIPSRFMKIDRIPLTPNNKVDHKALPDPEVSPPQLESGYLAPATGMEKLIADTWKEVLNLDKIGINDNFFSLGGNSLSLVKVIVKLRKLLMREIPTIMMLQYPTVHLLAQHLMEEEEKQNKISSVEKRDQFEKLDKGKERLKATRKKMK